VWTATKEVRRTIEGVQIPTSLARDLTLVSKLRALLADYEIVRKCISEHRDSRLLGLPIGGTHRVDSSLPFFLREIFPAE
jgi:hypothetical protein